MINALVVETAFPGDVVISLALVAELKRLASDARITYLVRPDAADLAMASPDVDDVIIFDKRGADKGVEGIVRVASLLNEREFTHLFLLHSSDRSIELAKRLDVPVRIGFASKDAVTHRIDEPPFGTPRTSRAISLLTAIFDNVDQSTLPRLDTSQGERMSETIALAPGSAWATKKWGDDKFVELARLLLDEGKQLIVIGGRDEKKVGNRISALSKDRVIDLTGKTTLVEAAEVISKCALLIGNDSAPIHLATAVKTPSVVIYGPTVKEFGFAPPSEMSKIVEVEDLWCRPCTAHGSDTCPIFTHKCMKAISATEVAKTALMFFIFREKIVGG
ncbi:MAG TPA: glycosyltransferase family 9 protein [Candidatus Kapabacteria bacterium]|nr:glycosyltransferase family 9 protein [Candidatus Kapabacteria bacterium]